MISLGINPTGKLSRRRKFQVDVVLRMCEQIAHFMKQHDGASDTAYLSCDRGAVGLYLLTKAEVYDFELSDKLAEFAGPYLERGLLDSFMLLPACSPDEMTAFFDPNSAVRIEIDHG
jgi:hypothetical protein